MSKFSAESKLKVKRLDLKGLVHKSKLGERKNVTLFASSGNYLMAIGLLARKGLLPPRPVTTYLARNLAGYRVEKKEGMIFK